MRRANKGGTMFHKLLLALVLIPSIACAQNARYAHRLRDKAEIEERAKIFGREMQRLGFSGEIQSCNLMMQVAVGTRGGNTSYGAICVVAFAGNTQSLMLCDDDMVGHFGLKAFTFVESEDEVASFARRNCYGG
jgi:hypothetical protein